MKTTLICAAIIAATALLGTFTMMTIQAAHADPKPCAGNPHDRDSGTSGNPHDNGESGNPHDTRSFHGNEADTCPGSQ